jgi:hypothetical protein
MMSTPLAAPPGIERWETGTAPSKATRGGAGFSPRTGFNRCYPERG